MKLFTTALTIVALASPAACFDGSIRADSNMGQKLMGKARQLNNNNNNNNYYYSWIADAALKFDGCASIPMFERDEGLRSNLVAKFKLCPNNSCNSCHNGGEYIVEMREFVETYQDALKESREYECETAKESCEYNCQNGNYQNYNGNANANYNNANGDYNANGNYNANYNYNNGQNNNNNNNNNNEDYCLNNCLMEQGLDYCIEEEGQDQDEIKEFAECRLLEVEGGNNNNNNYNYNYNYNQNYQVYYTGAYCTSSGVYAGIFTDSTCTTHAPKGTYEKYNYGYSLPSQPLVSSTCMSCKANNNDNNGNNNDDNNNGIAEVCEQLYEEALKCESNVKATYKDTSGCEMIHNILPQLNKAMKNIRGPDISKTLAWVFGIGFFALAGYLFTLHQKAAQQKKNLNSEGAYISGIPS